jgi:hypothetical protein
MKQMMRLLLPVVSIDELDLFCGLPAEALLAAGNLPAAAKLFDLTVSVLAPSACADRLDRCQQVEKIRLHARVEAVLIDDLVVDHEFEIVRSLAYMRDLAGRGESLTRTAFVFLQPNLVFADGALGAAARRLAGGARVINATYLRADRGGFLGAVGVSGHGAQDLSPRSLVRHATRHPDLGDHANIVNSDLPLSGPAARLFWRHDDATLIAHDFMPSLLALCPTHPAGEARGFCGPAFAAAMCPDSPPQQANDSDELLGIELTSEKADSSISLVSDRMPGLIHVLSGRTTAQQRATALNFPTVFHAREIPSALTDTSTKAHSYIRQLVDYLTPPQPALDDLRWKVALYLWGVRRFELGRGSLPEAHFEHLLPRSAPAATAGASPRLQLRQIPVMIFRYLRRLLLGHVPLVTVLHPDWLDYRPIKPVLQAASQERVWYVADGVAGLARVLGTPACTSAQFLNDSGQRPRNTVDTVIFELTDATLATWGNLVSRAMPVLGAGGRIVIFHRVGSRSEGALKHALATGSLHLNALPLPRLSVTLVSNSSYRNWLRRGYPIALDYGRRRRAPDLLKAFALFSIASVLTMVLNLSSMRRANSAKSADAYSSLTITMDIEPLGPHLQ